MTRFEKIYERHIRKRKLYCQITKHNSMNREGYGYIKRRLGILSGELESPVYSGVEDLCDYTINNTETKSSQ